MGVQISKLIEIDSNFCRLGNFVTLYRLLRPFSWPHLEPRNGVKGGLWTGQIMGAIETTILLSFVFFFFCQVFSTFCGVVRILGVHKLNYKSSETVF